MQNYLYQLLMTFTFLSFYLALQLVLFNKCSLLSPFFQFVGLFCHSLMLNFFNCFSSMLLTHWSCWYFQTISRLLTISHICSRFSSRFSFSSLSTCVSISLNLSFNKVISLFQFSSLLIDIVVVQFGFLDFLFQCACLRTP